MTLTLPSTVSGRYTTGLHGCSQVCQCSRRPPWPSPWSVARPDIATVDADRRDRHDFPHSHCDILPVGKGRCHQWRVSRGCSQAVTRAPRARAPRAPQKRSRPRAVARRGDTSGAPASRSGTTWAPRARAKKGSRHTGAVRASRSCPAARFWRRLPWARPARNRKTASMSYRCGWF